MVCQNGLEFVKSHNMVAGAGKGEHSKQEYKWC